MFWQQIFTCTLIIYCLIHDFNYGTKPTRSHKPRTEHGKRSTLSLLSLRSQKHPNIKRINNKVRQDIKGNVILPDHPKQPIRLRFFNYTKKFLTQEADFAMETAIKAWKSVVDIDLTLTVDTQLEVSYQIFFVTTAHINDAEPVGDLDILLRGKEIYFNDTALTYSDYFIPNGAFYNTALHMIGHLLRVGHNFAPINCAVTKNAKNLFGSLCEEEIATARINYGVRNEIPYINNWPYSYPYSFNSNMIDPCYVKKGQLYALVNRKTGLILDFTNPMMTNVPAQLAQYSQPQQSTQLFIYNPKNERNPDDGGTIGLKIGGVLAEKATDKLAYQMAPKMPPDNTQLFIIERKSDMKNVEDYYCRIKSARDPSKYLAVDSSTTPPKNLILTEKAISGEKAYLGEWQFREVPGSHCRPVTGKKYKIQNGANKKYLTMTETKDIEMRDEIAGEKNNKTTQIWEFDRIGFAYIITADIGDKSLSVTKKIINVGGINKVNLILGKYHVHRELWVVISLLPYYKECQIMPVTDDLSSPPQATLMTSWCSLEQFNSQEDKYVYVSINVTPNHRWIIVPVD